MDYEAAWSGTSLALNRQLYHVWKSGYGGVSVQPANNGQHLPVFGNPRALAAEKLVGLTTCLTFLGIVIDTLAQELRLPIEKLERIEARVVVHRWPVTCGNCGQAR